MSLIDCERCKRIYKQKTEIIPLYRQVLVDGEEDVPVCPACMEILALNAVCDAQAERMKAIYQYTQEVFEDAERDDYRYSIYELKACLRNIEAISHE